MMEPAEDWYRCDAADEDFFNSLLGDSPLTVGTSSHVRFAEDGRALVYTAQR